MTKKRKPQQQAKCSTSSIDSPQPSTSAEIPHVNLIKEIVHSELFRVCLSDMIWTCMESIQTKLTDLSQKMAEIDEALSSHQESINELKSIANELKSMSYKSPLFKDNDNGTYLLRIHGLNAESSDICNHFHSIVSTKLSIQYDPSQFSTVGAHDDSIRNNNRGTSSAVTIKVENQDLWTKIYKSRPMLKGTSIYISEVLSSSNQFLFYLSRRLKKDNRIAATWTYKGQIYIRTYEDNILEIKSPSDLSLY